MSYVRPFLKWPGGKYNLLPRILPLLRDTNTLVEPFVGAGAVFLNTEYKHYWLNDINSDLINLYAMLKRGKLNFINKCQKLFIHAYNNEESYYKFRQDFNNASDKCDRARLFLYLNRHGYNGLCRYNLSGKFNVPFGRYIKPYFPEKELLYFCSKASKVKLTNLDFEKFPLDSLDNAVVYCDPPYAPLEKYGFTQYHTHGFDLGKQQNLAASASKFSSKSVQFVISNHATRFTKNLYKSAFIKQFKVRRFISAKVSGRTLAKELIAVF